MFNKVAAIVLVAAVLGANAQSSASSAPTSIPSGITTCSLGCIAQSLSAGGCTAITDLQCLCTSSAFQQATAACLQSQCPGDLAAATAVQQAQCAGIGSASSGAASSTAPPSASSNGASASSASGSASSGVSVTSGGSSVLSSATTSPSATGNNNGAAPINIGGLAGLAVAALGVVAGAGFIL
ncbi:hypothetical protein QCA50_004645 [Cerrena zonata]|uniref:CFEM domain-containing protein n=1 Tax=Cerrena zonata TaxID=2478898 RepID=A0AAW0GFA5_9APHY